MRYLNVRDLQDQPDLLEQCVTVESVTLTSNGRPFALVVGLAGSEGPEDLERLIRQARAQSAVSRIRRRAQAESLDQLSADEIGAEISQARRH
jgi:antitoxin (DNA-binding transcriptional repressor) of toxin-antitoxin stability system